jgi:phosphatidylglycerol:prolipoprotein diacylglycerol transferase
VALYAWRAGLSPLKWLDYGAPGLALGQAVGRWGNFVNQELYGPPTDLPWGLRIDAQHRIIPYNDLERFPADTLFHPTFLYESLWSLAVFGILAVIADKLKDRVKEGDIILGYLIGYPLGRFFLEYLRPDAWMIGPIAAAQLFAVLCVIGAGAILVIRHAVGKTPATVETEEPTASGAAEIGRPPEAGAQS